MKKVNPNIKNDCANKRLINMKEKLSHSNGNSSIKDQTKICKSNIKLYILLQKKKKGYKFQVHINYLDDI